MSDSSGVQHALADVLALLGGALLLAGCASNIYMGIPLSGGTAGGELQMLAARARSGDQHAQFELAKRFEQGHGVERAPCRALRLYRLAASPAGGQTAVYVPAAGGAAGTVIPVDLGPRRSGLAEAKIEMYRIKESQTC
jgi:hypothetical protein